jgi:hypothetical protein
LWASNLKKIRYWGKIEAIWIDAIYIGLAALAVLLKLYIDSVDEYERNASVIYKNVMPFILMFVLGFRLIKTIIDFQMEYKAKFVNIKRNKKSKGIRILDCE